MDTIEIGAQRNLTSFDLMPDEQAGKYVCDLSGSLFADGRNIKMGDKLVFGIAGVNKQYNARLVGSVPDDHVMLMIEDEYLDPESLLLGVDIYCCHVSNESFQTFKSKIIKCSISPFSYLLITYPKEIKRLSAKRDVRFNTNLMALLHQSTGKDGKEKLVTARLLNIGVGGVLSTTVEPIGMVGDEVEIEVSLPCVEMKVDINLKARIKTVNDETDTKGRINFRYGMQFVELRTRESVYLKSYLFDHMQKEVAHIM